MPFLELLDLLLIFQIDGVNFFFVLVDKLRVVFFETFDQLLVLGIKRVLGFVTFIGAIQNGFIWAQLLKFFNMVLLKVFDVLFESGGQLFLFLFKLLDFGFLLVNILL